MKPVTTQRPVAGLLAPGAQAAAQRRLGQIDTLLTSAVLSPSLEKALVTERAALKKRLLAGATSAVLSPSFVKRAEARLKAIDKLLLAGTVQPAAEKRLTREKRELVRLLKAA